MVSSATYMYVSTRSRSAGDEAWRRGENAWACRAALGLKKFARADHHDILEKRRLGNANASLGKSTVTSC